MRRIPSWGIVIGIILVAAIVGCGLGWWVSRDSSVQTTTTQVSPPAVEENSHVTQIPTAPVTVAVTPAVPPATNTDIVEDPALDPAVASGEEPWQRELDEVLTTEGEPEQKADRLLKLLPNLKEEAQVEISQHLVNFVMDDHYLPLGNILTNASTSEAVASVLMTDLLNRNDNLKLPILLSLARNENHPKHTDAKDLLELYLQENHGDDWAQWESSVTNWLAQNAPEPTLDAPPEPTTQANP